MRAKLKFSQTSGGSILRLTDNLHLKPEQIEWGEFLIKNKIPYKVLRVLPK